MANTNINDGMERGKYRAKELEFSSYCSGAAPIYGSGGTFTGAVSVGTSLTATTAIAGVNVTNTGSTMNTKHTEMELTGSPYGEGLVYNFTCAAAATGGQYMYVEDSIAKLSGAIGQVTGVIYGSAKYPSGTSLTVPLVVYGLKYLTCADDVGNADYVTAGSAAHTVASGALSTLTFGKVLGAASSGGAALVMVGKL